MAKKDAPKKTVKDTAKAERKKTAKKVAKKTSKKTAKKSGKKVAKKSSTKASTLEQETEVVENTRDTENDLDKFDTDSEVELEDDLQDSDDEEIIPLNLEGDHLRKEIKELESVENGKKTIHPPKKTGKTGSRRAKQRHIVTARKPSGGLKLAPGVMLSGAKKPKNEASTVCAEPKEFRRMTEEELKITRKKLIELRESILENMRKELADYRHRASSSSADPVDQAADAYDDDVTFEIAANSDEELEQIESALEKIEKGTYGLCEICNVTISPSRLKILPFATRCVNCRQDYEKTKSKKEATSSWAFLDGDEADNESS